MVPRCNLSQVTTSQKFCLPWGQQVEAPGRPHVSSPQCYLLQWSCCGALWAKRSTHTTASLTTMCLSALGRRNWEVTATYSVTSDHTLCRVRGQPDVTPRDTDTSLSVLLSQYPWLGLCLHPPLMHCLFKMLAHPKRASPCLSFPVRRSH